MPTPRTSRSTQTRRDILARAMDIASVEGLEGLSIGRLASAISMSKSGLFAHFGSKEELQLAVVDAAAGLFTEEVLSGPPREDEALERLWALSREWLAYIEKGLFRGGCFFAAVSAEMDDKPGRVRDQVVHLTRAWTGLLERAAAEAVAAGHLDGDGDPAQLAFELHAFVQEANWAFQLHGEAEAFNRARRAIRRSLEAAATPEGLSVLRQLEIHA
ncbi:MAG: TetR/AcrR family transcriptional regulator [Candidatus Binatia bacterium]